MKFNELYKKVFITEENSEVAHPDDFNDVEPMPVPEPSTAESQPEGNQTTVQTGSGLTDYINQLEEFANKLNGTDGSSLQSLVANLDKIETPFEGIYSRTSAEIVDAAKTLRSISEKIKNFVINAAKK
jgi:hypothetical protein